MVFYDSKREVVQYVIFDVAMMQYSIFYCVLRRVMCDVQKIKM